MQLVEVLLLGVAIGAVLGGLGGGGAILTVPALVYVIGQGAQEATTASLVIVGLTALVGVLSYTSGSQVRWGLALAFGLVGFPATWAGTQLNHQVDPDVLLLGFAVLMCVAAAAMVRGSGSGDAPDPGRGSEVPARADRDPNSPSRGGGVALAARATTAAPTAPRIPVAAVIATALAVGLITGFFGVGGGFVVVPALVLVLRLPMHQAVGTSLLIVALNSATSLVSRLPTATFDWSVIIPFTLAAMLATLAGKRVADRLPAPTLKQGFAALLVLVALYTGWQSATGLAAAIPDSPNSPNSAGGAVGAGGTAAPASQEDPSVATADLVRAAEAIEDGAVVIDVRTPKEFATGHLDDALNADLGSSDFTSVIGALDSDEVYVLYCASGARAAAAVEQMRARGFTRLINGGGYDELLETVAS